jgi:prephenate dehydrogenase
LLEKIAPDLKPGAIVTDVGSTKRSIVKAAEKVVPKGVHFVASHPMAGSEKRGVEFARADLFDGALCIVTPTEWTDRSAIQQVEKFWQLIGMRTLRLSPEEHDERLAAISHMPHALAAALVATQESANLPLTGKGFLDMTRIAAGDPGLWRDIFIDNRDNLAASLRSLQRSVDGLLDRLDPAKSDELFAWLKEAADRRAKMNAGQQE